MSYRDNIERYRRLASNPRVRAMLDTIAHWETSNYRGNPSMQYRTIFGGSTVSDLSRHPSNRPAGRYQIQRTTYNDAVRELGISDFQPETQDLIAIWLMDCRGSLDHLLNGDLRSAILGNGKATPCGKSGLGWEWAVLPGNNYGQTSETLSSVRKVYESYLGSGSSSPINENNTTSEADSNINNNDSSINQISTSNQVSLETNLLGQMASGVKVLGFSFDPDKCNWRKDTNSNIRKIKVYPNCKISIVSGGNVATSIAAVSSGNAILSNSTNNKSSSPTIGNPSATGGKLNFICPVQSPRMSLTGRFGDPRSGGKRRHKGIDLSTVGGSGKGSPLLAPKDGKVIRRDYQECGAGHWIRIDHGEGVQTVFMHIHAGTLTVDEGQTVRQGQILGYEGASGLTCWEGGGTHLHFEIYINGSAVNPLPYVCKQCKVC